MQTEAALGDSSCWLPGLAPRMVARFWRDASFDLKPADYTTAGWLTRPQRAVQQPPIAQLDFAGATLLVEAATPVVAAELDENGLSLASLIQVQAATDTLHTALACLNKLPSLSATVGALARSIHILTPAEAGFDVSHSNPAIPFSIFLSVPTGEAQSAWRTAESIVHEAMHLQLSLIEREVPLVGDRNEDVGFSPWQRRARPLQGLLHGMYVSSVIGQMFAHVSPLLMEDRETHRFINQRRQDIANELEAVASLPSAVGLTVQGARFARHLLSQVARC